MARAYLRRDFDPQDGLMYGHLEFGSQSIHLHRMAKEHDLDYSYLWRVFHGYRIPSLTYARRLAGILQMSIEDFLKELDRLKRPTTFTDPN